MRAEEWSGGRRLRGPFPAAAAAALLAASATTILSGLTHGFYWDDPWFAGLHETGGVSGVASGQYRPFYGLLLGAGFAAFRESLVAWTLAVLLLRLLQGVLVYGICLELFTRKRDAALGAALLFTATALHTAWAVHASVGFALGAPFALALFSLWAPFRALRAEGAQRFLLFAAGFAAMVAHLALVEYFVFLEVVKTALLLAVAIRPALLKLRHLVDGGRGPPLAWAGASGTAVAAYLLFRTFLHDSGRPDGDMNTAVAVLFAHGVPHAVKNTLESLFTTLTANVIEGFLRLRPGVPPLVGTALAAAAVPALRRIRRRGADAPSKPPFEGWSPFVWLAAGAVALTPILATGRRILPDPGPDSRFTMAALPFVIPGIVLLVHRCAGRAALGLLFVLVAAGLSFQLSYAADLKAQSTSISGLWGEVAAEIDWAERDVFVLVEEESPLPFHWRWEPMQTWYAWRAGLGSGRSWVFRAAVGSERLPVLLDAAVLGSSVDFRHHGVSTCRGPVGRVILVAWSSAAGAVTSVQALDRADLVRLRHESAADRPPGPLGILADAWGAAR